MKISPREKGKTRDMAGSFLTRLAFLAWGDFHARARFARSTIPDRTNGFIFFNKEMYDRFACFEKKWPY